MKTLRVEWGRRKMVDTRGVPTALASWRATQGLSRAQLSTFMYFWSSPHVTAAGCYALPVREAAAALRYDDAAELTKDIGVMRDAGLVDWDAETAEILIERYFRFCSPKTAKARYAVEAALSRIESTRLRKKTERAYAASGATPGASTGSARHSELVHGCTIWTAEDRAAVAILAAQYGAAVVERAAGELRIAGTEPYPSRVSRVLQQETSYADDQYVHPAVHPARDVYEVGDDGLARPCSGGSAFSQLLWGGS